MPFNCCMKVLKTNTKEVLYEKYRTEKLLARRATRNISDDDRKRLLEGQRFVPNLSLLKMLMSDMLYTDLGL